MVPMGRSRPKALSIWLAGAFIIIMLLSSGCLDPDDNGLPLDDEDSEGAGPDGGGGEDDDTSSDEESLREDPVVKVSEVDYTGDPYSLPYTDVHDAFASVYNGSDLDANLRDALIDRMKELAVELGENGTLLEHCIEETYDDLEARPYMIPTYAEKCTYSEEDAWAIAFNRCNGFEDGIGHFDIYFMSIDTIKQMHHSGCNATLDPLLDHFGCQ